MDQISGYNLKKLYLLRHAKSSWDNPNLADFDRPLNKRGKENLSGLANLAAMLNPPPELVLTSPSKRTLETVKGFCQGIPGLFTIVEEKKLYHATKEEISASLIKFFLSGLYSIYLSNPKSLFHSVYRFSFAILQVQHLLSPLTKQSTGKN